MIGSDFCPVTSFLEANQQCVEYPKAMDSESLLSFSFGLDTK